MISCQIPGQEVYDVTKQEYEQVESRIDELISERVETIAKNTRYPLLLIDDIVVLDNKDLNATFCVDDQGIRLQRP